ncbi:MAG: hypothetical protein IPJ83_17365 [Saprospiraceae bacterium]|nr:hypothetical protein [Candidatus Vicinibacter proximus]
MYEILLNLHSWLRWLVLGMAVVVIYNNYNGWKSGLVYSDKDKKLNTYLMLLLHSQLVIGLALYFGVSPMMKDIMANFGGSMKDSAQRFWSVEHMMGMVIGIIVAQIGASKAKNNPPMHKNSKPDLCGFTIAILIIILMIPFGIWNVERPMFRM